MKLSKGLRSALEALSQRGAELTYEKGAGYWIGFERISPMVGLQMLRLGLITVAHGSVDRYCVFKITRDGRKVLEDPDHIPEIVAIVQSVCKDKTIDAGDCE